MSLLILLIAPCPALSLTYRAGILSLHGYSLLLHPLAPTSTMAGERLSDMELSSSDEADRTARPQEKKAKADKTDAKKEKKEKKDKKEKKSKKTDDSKAEQAEAVAEQQAEAVHTVNGASDKSDKKEKKDKKDKKDKKRVREENGDSVTIEQNGNSSHASASAPTATSSSKKRKVDDDEQPSTKKQKPASASASTSATATATASTADQPDANGNPPLASFPIHATTLALLHKKGITHAFPIQAATFQHVLTSKDVVGRARTGTGKTLAFALPICERLQNADQERSERLKVGRSPRVIVLTPTRELAKQVSETFELVGPRLSHTVVYGGSPYGPMEAALRRGVDVVVGTCGRVQDLIEKGSLKLSSVEVIIMDEADEMLNMGFADDVEKILQSVDRSDPNKPIQTLLFSATIPSWVQQVARKYLRPTHERIDLIGEVAQKASSDVVHYAIACHWSERNSLLKEVIAAYGPQGEKTRTIVFTETKKDANEIALSSSISAISGVLHGDIAQAQRETTLKSFREGRFSCLIATDVAARGIDISGVGLVIQLEPPQSTETYIHRSGRTGRAGGKGVAVTFYTAKQMYWIQQIERQAKVKLERAGIPQRDDIYGRSAQQAVQSVLAVHPQVIPHFLSAARELLLSTQFMPAKEADAEDDGSDSETEVVPEPVYVLAAALAHASGHTQPLKARSLLMGASGYTTVQYTSTVSIRSLSFVWSQIRRWLYTSETESNERVKGMRLTADRMSAVFDVPSEDEEKVAELTKRMEGVKGAGRMEVCKQLPTLQQQEMEQPERRRWGGRSSFGGGDRRGGGGGGGRGGRGGGRGGRGGRGRSSY